MTKKQDSPLVARTKNAFGFPANVEPVENNEAVKKYFEKLKTESDEVDIDINYSWSRLLEAAQSIVFRFGKELIIDESNEAIWKYIALYLCFDSRASQWIQSKNHKQINSFSFNKGILICGSYGVGKSLLFRSASHAQVPGNKFQFHTTNSVVQKYESEGPKTLKDFFNHNICFDDFGTESKAWHYGKQVDIFQTILEERYNAFIDKSLKTHISTNLTVDEIGKRYGARVESRIHEMFNIIVLTGKDRRKQ